jgi:hypothetical protein
MNQRRLASGAIEFTPTEVDKLRREKKRIERELIPLLADILESLAERPEPKPRNLKAGRSEEEGPSEFDTKLERMKGLRDQLKTVHGRRIR